MTAVLLAVSCKQKQEAAESIIGPETKVVTLNGTLTEIVCALGFESNLVGVDVTSTYPASVLSLPKAGHTRSITAEGLLSMNPEVVLAIDGEINPEMKQQLSAAGVKLYLFPAAYNVEQADQLIQTLADTLGVSEKAAAIREDIASKLARVQPVEPKPKVLFIYARGAGMLMVAGEKTALNNVIKLAGAQNAVGGFEDFKPLSPEVLVEANPDIVLLFDSGIQSLEGEKGLLAVPGLAQTNAGKNKAFISMDGQYLSGFGPRLGDAVLELNQKILALTAPK